MVNKVDVTELSQSVDALIEKYGKLSGSASATAKAAIRTRAYELRDAIERASHDLPPAIERGVEATKGAAVAAKGAFVADIVPLAISALSTALDVISEKSEQAKSALADATTVAVEVAPEPKKKKSRSWIGFLIAPVVAVAAATVAFAVFSPADENWIPVEDEVSEDSSDE